MEPREGQERGAAAEPGKLQEHDIVERFSCAICLEPFVEPRILRCGHSFCKACIDDLRATPDGAVECPTCRVPCKMDDIGRNFALDSLLELYEYSVSMVGVYNMSNSAAKAPAAPAAQPAAPQAQPAPAAAVSPPARPAKADSEPRHIFIESQFAGQVIGLKRSRIKQVESATGTKIDIPPRPPSGVVVQPTDLVEFTITGPNENNINVAYRRIETMAASAKRALIKRQQHEEQRRRAEALAQRQREAIQEAERVRQEIERRQALLRQQQQQQQAQLEAQQSRENIIALEEARKQRQRLEQEKRDAEEARRLQEFYDAEHRMALLNLAQPQPQAQPVVQPVAAQPAVQPFLFPQAQNPNNAGQFPNGPGAQVDPNGCVVM